MATSEAPPANPTPDILAQTLPAAPAKEYIFGHAKDIVQAHSLRTAAKSAAFLLPRLTPQMSLLDVGCGPGSITCGFAEALNHGGHVTGVDMSAAVLVQARALAEQKGLTNLTFANGNILKGLPFADGAFDVVYCHQLLVHLSDPVAALREFKRLCKPGGMVAVREGDTHIWHTTNNRLERLFPYMATVMKANGVLEPQGGRHLKEWARKAGFRADKVIMSVSGSCNADALRRESFKQVCHGLLGSKGSVRTKAIEVVATEEEIDETLAAVDEWASGEDNWYSMVCGEIICYNDA